MHRRPAPVRRALNLNRLSDMNEITIAPALYARFLLRDGRLRLKFRVTLRRRTAFLTTSLVALPSQFAPVKGAPGVFRLTDPALRASMDTLHVSLSNRSAQIAASRDLSSMTVTQACELLRAPSDDGSFRLPFVAFARGVVASKRLPTRHNYDVALRSLCAYMRREEFDVSEITSSVMRGFEADLARRLGPRAAAVHSYPAAVAHMHRLAREKYNDEELGRVLIRNPFAYYRPPKARRAPHRAFSAAFVQDMLDRRLSLEGRMRQAADAWLLSFFLFGMNACDMYECPAPARGADPWTLRYNRRKTRDRRDDGAPMEVRVPEAVRPLFDEWRAPRGSARAFRFSRDHASMESFRQCLNAGLHDYGRAVGWTGAGVTTYTARHTFATVCWEAGVDKALIGDCLCHVDGAGAVTDIYIRKDWSVLWAVGEKLASLFDFSKAYPDGAR